MTPAMMTMPIWFRVCFLILSCAVGIVPSTAQDESAENGPKENGPAENGRVAEIMKSFKGIGTMADGSQPTSPKEVLSTFSLEKGVAMDLVAHEPGITQPLFLSWDSRGRMWVAEYRQYQYPAGLKVVRFDQYLRAVFDKTPAPPPQGVRGLDRITVLEDTNQDGTFDSSKTVIDGLNIASSVQVGRGGIWVLNAPYLLFYPDADGDDVPDGDPEVHLSGFGIQDTHAIANSLTWGIDGWLYGACGSTTGGTVRSKGTPEGVSFEGQNIWRYHPESQRFEIFAEGGGNTFSLEIDSVGRVFAGTNHGKTRGLHFPQGAYCTKNWGKHGPLTNPHAYGYFEHMAHEGDDRRFPQAFLIYEGGLFPESFHGDIIAPNSLHNIVWRSQLLRDGSTYRTVDRDPLVESSDRWFRPVYSGVGPDGAIYMADWYDTRLSHLSPLDNWHKDSGRVYRIRPEGSSPRYELGDLAKRSSESLVDLFSHQNKWVRQRAVLELGWRGDDSITEMLLRKVDEDGSLESLWVLHALAQFTDDRVVGWLGHSSPHIRRWVIRLIGDARPETLAQTVAEGLVHLAVSEPDDQVCVQLAATAKRMDAATGLRMVQGLIDGNAESTDAHLPLMIWWAMEAHADAFDAMKPLLTSDGFWQSKLAQTTLHSRLMQRCASTGSDDQFKHAAALMKLAPDEESRRSLLMGLNQAFQGRPVPSLPANLESAMRAYRESLGDSGVVLAVQQGDEKTYAQAIALLSGSKTEMGLRIELANALGEQAVEGALNPLLKLATSKSVADRALQRVAIGALTTFDDESIADRLIRGFQSSISNEDDLRATACRTLASREGWAIKLVGEVNQWRLKSVDVPADAIQRMRTFDSPVLSKALDQAFGKELTFSGPEKKAMIERVLAMLATTSGEAAAGKIHFDKKCATCHQLFGQGQSVGPPLDGYERSNPKFWLPAIIDPHLDIREGFQSYRALTFDGRVVTGMIADQSPETVTLRLADGKTSLLDREDLDIFEAIKTSLMPAGLLDDLSEQEVADLFAYLSRDAK